MDKFIIRTSYGVLLGKIIRDFGGGIVERYSILPPKRKDRIETIDDTKCFDSYKEAQITADEILESHYEIVRTDELAVGTFNCPHCERDYIHQHIIDKKGFVHSTILQGKG